MQEIWHDLRSGTDHTVKISGTYVFMFQLPTRLQLALRRATARYGVQLVQPVPRVRRCARGWYHRRDPSTVHGEPEQSTMAVTASVGEHGSTLLPYMIN